MYASNVSVLFRTLYSMVLYFFCNAGNEPCVFLVGAAGDPVPTVVRGH